MFSCAVDELSTPGYIPTPCSASAEDGPAFAGECDRCNNVRTTLVLARRKRSPVPGLCAPHPERLD